jgi:hypothetical protein
VALALGAGGAAATLAVSNKMQPDAVPADESEAEPADAEVTAD